MSEPDNDVLAIKKQIGENQKIIDELNEKIHRKNQEVQIIQQISSEINAILDVEKIMDTVLDTMDVTLGFKHTMILLKDKSEDILRVAASRGYKKSGYGAEVKFGQGTIGVVAKRKKMMRMGNISSQMAYMATIKSQMNTEQTDVNKIQLPGLQNVDSQIAFPLMVKDKLVGIFAVESDKPNAFDDLDQIILSIVANQIASAIDNARLYMEEKERRAQMDQLNADLKNLNENLEDQVNKRTKELTVALDAVQYEKRRSEELLNGMAPPEVIPLMLDDKLKPRMLNATIMFTDFQGFTQFSSGLEPDELFSQLNHFFSQGGESIHNYRGYVNKTNGDSIMALFGIPFGNKTHAIDAILAALDIQKKVKDSFALAMRIGLNTGPITAGILGPDNKSIYDVIGDTVNVASRMEKACPPGGVTITEETLSLVSRYFNVENLGKQAVKGKGEMDCFSVIGLKTVLEDHNRIDSSSIFAKQYSQCLKDVENFKASALDTVNLISIQSRDGSLTHNEAVAALSLALLRYTKSSKIVANDPELKKQVEEISEEDLLYISLLHDLGKYKIEYELLNDSELPHEKANELRELLKSNTIEAFEQLNLDFMRPILEKFYEFEQTKGARVEENALVRILVLADIYDALTSPKIYRGKPWRNVGTLEELLRMSHYQESNDPLFQLFVTLMKPESAVIDLRTRKKVIFK